MMTCAEKFSLLAFSETDSLWDDPGVETALEKTRRAFFPAEGLRDMFLWVVARIDEEVLSDDERDRVF